MYKISFCHQLDFNKSISNIPNFISYCTKLQFRTSIVYFLKYNMGEANNLIITYNNNDNMDVISFV